jgi:hypothetical protein
LKIIEADLKIFFRDSINGAFQPLRRKSQFDGQLMRRNSTDCSNEIKDYMLPWLPEDFVDDTPVVTIQ